MQGVGLLANLLAVGAGPSANCDIMTKQPPATGVRHLGEKPQPPFERYVPGRGQRSAGVGVNGKNGPSVPFVPGADQESAVSFYLDGVEGRIDRRKANIANRLVETAPEEALQVIRRWLHQD